MEASRFNCNKVYYLNNQGDNPVKQLLKTVMFKLILALTALPLTAIAAESTQPMATGEPADSYLTATGYTLEKHSNAAPVITAHFDHCKGNPLAREKRIAKGILIGNDRVLAPADYFIDPCSPPIVLPDSSHQLSNNYYCHDQRIKKISHLSLITPSHTETENETDETWQPTRAATPKIIRVLNELHFDGTSTVDALLCHRVENGTINVVPAVAVLSLSKRGVGAIPTEIATAQLYDRSGNTGSELTATYSSLLLRNHMHFLNSETTARPESQEITQLIAAARQLQFAEESKGNTRFDAQPAALITSTDDRHYLTALVNDWEIIEEFPSLYDLPDYAQRHPYISKLWKGSSPMTGTISHTLGMQSIPSLTGAAGGILATVEIASTAMLFYIIASYLSSSPHIYTVMKAGLGIILASGFYRWATSEY
ncbi:hypothetical protein ACTL6P_06610 [Endozoicomonas acroporae]|uniref:hypothetical protein n=1 Tax=Endozoicomonas acroporae TaxID=1701104 RepID=UPI000C75AB8B|nr:hypothetical protein [Endozoicomonas acroporae]